MPQPIKEPQGERKSAPRAERAPDHRVTVSAREGMTVTGVSDVSSFDEEGVVMETVCGTLTVDGEGLGVTRLDLAAGEVEIGGRVVGMYYVDSARRKKRFLRRG